jgi:hypothetical protein
MLEHAVASASDGARAATADESLGLDAPLDFFACYALEDVDVAGVRLA